MRQEAGRGDRAEQGAQFVPGPAGVDVGEGDGVEAAVPGPLEGVAVRGGAGEVVVALGGAGESGAVVAGQGVAGPC